MSQTFQSPVNITYLIVKSNTVNSGAIDGGKGNVSPELVGITVTVTGLAYVGLRKIHELESVCHTPNVNASTCTNYWYSPAHPNTEFVMCQQH